MSQRRWGTTRCRKFLSRHQIPETKPIGTLTERQRCLLANALREHLEPPLASVDGAVDRDRALAFA
jgi:hypothetical protein